MTSLETSEYSSKNKKGKAIPSSAASCSCTKLVEDELENEDKIWVCGECNAEWEIDDNRWIVCDNCVIHCFIFNVQGFSTMR